MFVRQIGQNVEVYRDDSIKQERGHHLDDLK